MSSINDKATVDAIIAANGKGNVVEILTYNNIFDGGLTYKLIYKGQDADVIASQIAGMNVQSIWRKHA
jgi:hypothetical protein